VRSWKIVDSGARIIWLKQLWINKWKILRE
jgi:hypothetical protein